MLRIRLRRVGRKNDPHFQIVVTPRTNATKSDYLEKLGWFDPITKQIQVDEVSLKKWLDNGAKPTNTVAKLLVGKKIKHKHIVYIPAKPKKPKKKEKDSEKPKAEAAPKESKEDAIKEDAAKDETSNNNINQETKKEEVK